MLNTVQFAKKKIIQFACFNTQSHIQHIHMLVTTKSQENRMFKSQPMAYLSQIHLLSQSSNVRRERK